MKKRTGLHMIRALLALPPLKLSKSEKRAFQNMYDDLINGKIIDLSKKQRAWAETVYVKNKLDQKLVELPPRVPVKRRDPGKKDGLLDFGPLPKKPPGRT